MNSLVWMDVERFHFFLKEKEVRNAYEPHDDQIAVLDFSVFRPHLA